MKVALTIAGFDPTAGAGVLADVKTFAALQVYGASVVTAITVQDTREVRRSQTLDAKLVADELAAVLGDLPVAAAKTGMLGTAAVIEAIVPALRASKLPLVVDPVMVSSSGAELLDRDGRAALVRDLLPLAAIVTPNLPEAAVLTGRRVETIDEAKDAARAIRDLGAAIVVIKGGHREGATCDDIVFDGEFTLVSGARIATTSTHGTGCALSAAIAAHLALGSDSQAAIRAARSFVAASLAAARPLGRGRGPMHHLHPHYAWEASG